MVKIVLGVLGSLVLALLLPWGVRVNVTKSLPYTVFLSARTEAENLEFGSFVSFSHPNSSRSLAKQVIGLPGDRIKKMGSNIHLNGVFIENLQTQSSSGMSLTPVEEGTIPEGFVFVFAPHEKSFDSRYAEFGLIEQKNIKEVLWPLF